MNNKIALEEHLSTEAMNRLWDDTGEASRNGKAYMKWVDERLLDVDQRLRDMDACGIALTILSLTSPGIQSITDVELAVSSARAVNDQVHREFVEPHPDRFAFFASVPMQDPQAAAHELRRSVSDLGAKGAIINGYTNVGDGEHARYLDEPENEPLWRAVDELGVPVYLHPREPLPSQTRIYDGYSSLVGSAWAFGHETATHAVRLMLSGLFDQMPDVQVILGHLGEGLPFTLPRLEHRLEKQREGEGLGRAKEPVGHYFNNNFLLTTSGHFHTRTLQAAISEIGVDRVLFSSDYPYETMQEAVEWFDASLLCRNDKLKVGRGNAARVFGVREG
ncbi:MAG: O-pyrocatechuate decarboxylase [Conexibacter sp.]|nr:O-pyrocatechuate decarboxylase [Conexibacter sp.]